MATIDDRDSYSAPVSRAQKDRLHAVTTTTVNEVMRYFDELARIDSIDLHHMADEFEELARDMRDKADAAIDQFQERARTG